MKKNSKDKIIEEDHDKIKDYYSRALIALQSDDPAKGGKIILHEMPMRLYDLSLDILENKNNKFSNQSLRVLIVKVDKMLVDYSEDDSDSDIPDEFIRGTF